jgi:hypothetical protein
MRRGDRYGGPNKDEDQVDPVARQRAFSFSEPMEPIATRGGRRSPACEFRAYGSAAMAPPKDPPARSGEAAGFLCETGISPQRAENLRQKAMALSASGSHTSEKIGTKSGCTFEPLNGLPSGLRLCNGNCGRYAGAGPTTTARETVRGSGDLSVGDGTGGGVADAHLRGTGCACRSRQFPRGVAT